jgi:hypothetical protein
MRKFALFFRGGMVYALLTLAATRGEEMKRRILGMVAAASLVLVGLVAAGSRAQPACSVPTNDDNVGFSAFNRAHFGQERFGLVVVEGWLNACEDAEGATNVSATGKAILVHQAARVQLRAILEQQDPASVWVVQTQSGSVNSSGAFSVQASAPEDPDLGQPDTYRVRIRVLIRWNDNTTSFQEFTTKPYSFV